METRTHYGTILLAILLAMGAIPSRAQVTINVMVPGAGIYLKPQLWNLSVTNPQAGAVDAQVRMQLKDMLTHETVLSAVSATVRVPHGTKMLQDASLQPIQYTYGTGLADRSTSGMLPVGRYQACYQLYVSAEGGMEPVSDDCSQLQVEPLSPPVLTMPEDTATVETATPAFTWMPPAPLSMFGNLNYDLLLSEVYPGQAATDAVQKNLPVQQAQALGQPFFQYPVQSQQLDTGKTYAWQVVARDGARFAAKSEVWTFRIGGGPMDGQLKDATYYFMGARLDATYTVTGDVLHVKYANPDAAYNAALRFLDENNEVIATSSHRIRAGDNYLNLSLGRRFAPGHNYRVVLPYQNGGDGFSLTFNIK